MQFNSYIFILLFLPLSVFVYFLLCRTQNKKVSNAFLVCASLLFCGYAGINNLCVLVLSILINYFLYLLINKNRKKQYLIIGLLFNIIYLLAFKYSNFIFSNINSLIHTSIVLDKIVLPLAISYYTFSQISFLIDTYRGEIENVDIIDYVLYVVYFPKLIEGPIMFFNELVSQFNDENRKKVNWDNIAIGIYAFIIGLSKKVLLADVFGKIADLGFSNVSNLDTTNAIIVMLSYSLQIYFDFSGYCDMAIGTSKMFNIDLLENFNSPYKSLSIIDFWNRWHICLTRFFRKYLYIPLGGNRKGELRTCINTLIVFIVSGFWHGANWTFVLWGLTNGILLVINKKYKDKLETAGPLFNGLLTFILVNLLWVLFRANSISEAVLFVKNILQLHIGGIDYELAKLAISNDVMFIEKLIFGKQVIGANHYLFMMLTIGLLIALGGKNRKELCENKKTRVIDVIISVLLLVLCIMSFSNISKFVYQFF